MGFSRAGERHPTPPEIHNYRIYLLTFQACLGSWMFGYTNAVIAGVLVLPSFVRDFHLPAMGSTSYNNITSNIVSLVQVGGVAGAIATFPAMKYWGRKIALCIAAAVYFVGASLMVRRPISSLLWPTNTLARPSVTGISARCMLPE
jgi:MFS family permease